MFDSNTLSVYIVKLRTNYLREIITITNVLMKSHDIFDSYQYIVSIIMNMQ